MKNKNYILMRHFLCLIVFLFAMRIDATLFAENNNMPRNGTVIKEMAPMQFCDIFNHAFITQDLSQMVQLVKENPVNAIDFYASLRIRSKLDSQKGKIFREMADSLETCLLGFSGYDSVDLKLKVLEIEGVIAFEADSDYNLAMEKWGIGLALAKRSKKKSQIIFFLINIGNIHRSMGQFTQALEHYQEALSIHQEINGRKGDGDILANIGAVYKNLGQYEKARQYYQKALAVFDEKGDPYAGGKVLSNIGNVYRKLGLPVIALEYHQKALEVLNETEDPLAVGNAYFNIGAVHLDNNQPEKALKNIETAQQIYTRIRYLQGVSDCLANIAMVYALQGLYGKAINLFQQSLTFDRNIGNTSGVGTNLANIAEAYARRSQYQTAMAHFLESIQLSEKSGALETLWRAQGGLAIAESKVGKNQQAITHFEQALKTIESIREGLCDKKEKSAFMLNKLYVYDSFIELLQRLHKQAPDKEYDRRSLEIFERKQCRVFLELMGQSRARSFAGIPQRLLLLDADLTAQLNHLQTQQMNENSKPDTQQNRQRVHALEEQMVNVRTEQQKFKEQIKIDYPDYHALKYPQPVSLKALQRQVLNSNEIMLVYGVMEHQTCLWVIGKDHFSLHIIGEGEVILGKKISDFKRAIKKVSNAIQKEVLDTAFHRAVRRSLKDIRLAGSELSSMLIPPEAQQAIAKAKTLYIVPTGSLYALPFETLVLREMSGMQQSNYLVEKVAVTYLSSASLLKILREADGRRNIKAEHPLLAFAHPVYSNNGKSGMQISAPPMNVIRSQFYFDLMGGRLIELPETETEIREIGRILGATPASTPYYLRQNAARSMIFRLQSQGKLADYRYVVFACHGILPGEINQITQPALALTLPDPQTGTDDFLTMADVFQLKFNADFVTLSACNTGLGEAVKGEGIIGFTRAFMYAGTPSVSVSLWPVESGSTATLSTGFYANLKKGLSKAEALRSTKLEMISGDKGGLYRHPFFWASTVIFGDGK